MTSSQPQAVAVLRDKLEALYQADLASDKQEMSKIQKEGVALWTELMKAKEARQPRKEEEAEAEAEAEAAVSEEKESMLDWSMVEKHFENGSDTGSKLGASNISVRRVAALK